MSSERDEAVRPFADPEGSMTVDVSTRSRMAAPIRAYAARFHAALGDRHHIASPLGAWLLLALCAPASTGRAREQLTDVLGMDIDAAFALASQLIDRPHPAVPTALGVWTRDGLESAAFARWLSWLPVRTARGAMPTQAELDEWVRRESLGVLERSAATVHPLTVLLLVSVLATRVKWMQPFDVEPADALGEASAWSHRLSRVLTSHDAGPHGELICGTGRVGDVAVHVARAHGGVDVVSVIAEADVPPRDVLDAAHEIAIAIANDEPLARRSLFELPIGETARWTIVEQEIASADPDARLESYRSVLPAWSATASLSLDDPALGFAMAADALEELLGERVVGREVIHSVRARYSRTGFEAAAETSMTFFGMSQFGVQNRGLLRRAVLRFCQRQ